MAVEHDIREPLIARSLLARRDLAYLLSLLIPVAVYVLGLKSLLIFSAPSDPAVVEGLGLMQIRLPIPKPPEFVEVLALMQSDLLFNLGYILLWIALFAAVRAGVFRRVLTGLCHTLTICIALITTVAYQYFKATGSTLDADTLILGVSSLDELGGLITSEVSLNIVVLVFLMLLYTVLGPSLVTSYVNHWYSGRDTNHLAIDGGKCRSWRIGVLGLLGPALILLSLLPAASLVGVSKSFARAPFINVMLTAVAVAEAAELSAAVTELPAVHLPAEARLQPTATTKRRNVVLIVLESTRAAATTPYNKELPTTPFMDVLAKSSLLVERAYAIIPHTHNALTAINCGIYPPLDPSGTQLLAIPDTLPNICLPHLLGAQGYNTVYFMSQVKSFENSQQILENIGYQDFYSLEDMDTAGFEPTNYFGYEDEIMLEPSRAWLEAHREGPFLAAYLTSAPHHDYLAPQKRHGRVAFTANDVVNRYLNSVRNQDFFLKQLFDQYRQLGLYNDTIFILLGDHGQGFGEHGRNGHDNAIYEEGLRIPLLIHDPQRFKRSARLEGPVHQLDILPTVADLLGYTIQVGLYNGSSLLRPLPNDRTLLFSCSGEQGCMASLKGTEKYIYHFDDRPDELFDLATDPAERNNLAEQRSVEELKKRRSELIAWRAKVRSLYETRAADE